jgi:hypothetical protein
VYTPSFRLRSFETIPDGYKLAVLQNLLEGLTIANIAYLLSQPHTPDLYAAGIRYLEEESGVDEWQDIPDTLARRTGDCEDLACWRVAELRVRYGQPKATRGISVDTIPDKSGQLVTTYHITVIHQDGRTEDPSRRLGMR